MRMRAFQALARKKRKAKDKDRLAGYGVERAGLELGSGCERGLYQRGVVKQMLDEDYQ